MPNTPTCLQFLWPQHPWPILFIMVIYITLVRHLRYRRKQSIEGPFIYGRRDLSTMTTQEAHIIINQLQELEFPYAFNKARRIALLKAGGIPTMSKLFAATGQNNKRNSGKRAVDTEILLREAQSKARGDERYGMAVARMNYLHARYRKSNKITTPDLLHTLGDGLAEILNVIEKSEWRNLTDVEICALGIFHKNLGEDMNIPFDVLPSYDGGWRDGMHFAKDLRDWTIRYEEDVARPVPTNDQYVNVYVDGAMGRFPGWMRVGVRRVLGAEVGERMRGSLCLEEPGPILLFILACIRETRRFCLRYLALPRVTPMKLVHETADPKTKRYHFVRKGLQPWYMKPDFWSRWGTGALFVRILGGKVPGSRGDHYHPQGYDLMTIGPDPQRGRGTEEMTNNIEVIRARAVAMCPFPHGKAGGLDSIRSI
ncbi:hypothetical protein BO94DRAFT_474198 [Aspergillus sclerotioniger CBS 115572]|uniref:ER-bound oxygenase mpaB/mpaB'/Rubber oxygenase catalytic domain-containing protein n=1 Tax=Aspergillus sclerotioniger CBS 115572 TaxID=1450535 RepID=A0A317VLK0_9EURO|nr:hypothetical protein BO94DRAFT_474198 [Aspergillus sclerotioniger CBS 115572]PWY75243.1 hypothetical protein BO94DRAFT_474198 [Aspergillus sclerotioniger CBS 115572]